MHKQGKVVAWDAVKGFGFIRSTQSLEDVFFHIRDWEGLNPPTLQAAVEFEEIHVGGKGPVAMGGGARGLRSTDLPKSGCTRLTVTM